MEVKIKKPCPYQEFNSRSPAYRLVSILHYLATHCLREMEMALINYKQCSKIQNMK
jgi:hypothetical protein